MLIAIYFFIANYFLPSVGAYFIALTPSFIILAGIVILFSAVGIKFNNLGTTITNALFTAIGYIVKTFINGISWIIKNAFRLLPNIFNRCKRILTNAGLKPAVSNILSVIIAIIFLIIVI